MGRGPGDMDAEDRGPWPVVRGSTEAEMSVTSYRDLRVWRLAIDWVAAVYRTSGRWPSEERFGLIAQVRRAAVSIPSNIAEGAERRTTGEFMQFLGIAQSSLAEAETQLIIAHRLGFLTEPELTTLLKDAADIGRMAAGLKTSLKTKASRR